MDYNKEISAIDKELEKLEKRKEQLLAERDNIHPDERVRKFLDRNGGRELLKNHNLNEYGKWKVKGEDPNPDFGGYHHNPKLGIFEGKLINVIEKAVHLPGFFTWGAGGIIEPYEEPTIHKL